MGICSTKIKQRLKSSLNSLLQKEINIQTVYLFFLLKNFCTKNTQKVAKNSEKQPFLSEKHPFLSEKRPKTG